MKLRLVLLLLCATFLMGHGGVRPEKIGDCTNQADCFTGPQGTLLQSNTDLIMELDNDNNGSESFQVKDGADAIQFEVEESGNTTSQGTITSGASTQPSFIFDDSDTTAETIDARIQSDATDAGSGTEDVDSCWAVQVNSLLTNRICIDADGNTLIQNAPLSTEDLICDGIFDLGTVETFTDSDATPDVSTGSYWNTNTTAVTITDFDGAGILDGQIITVFSKGAITYDCTASGLSCGTTDIVTASGDVATWQYDGTDWHLISFKDQSDDLGADAGGADTNAVKTICFDAASLAPLVADDNFGVLEKNAGTNQDIFERAFDDTTDECVAGKFAIPPDADEAGTATFVIWFRATDATAPNGVCWDFKELELPTAGDVSWDTALVTDNLGCTSADASSANEPVRDTATATLTSNDWDQNEMVYFQVCRDADGTQGTDDAVGDAYLHTFCIEIPRA